MSLEAITWAFRQEIPPAQRFTLVALANRADEEGLLYPSVRWVMKRTGFAERTVRQHIAYLRENRLLESDQQTREDGGRSTNLFRLLLNQPGLALSAPNAPPPAPNAPTPLHDVHHPPAPDAPPSNTKKLKDKQKGPYNATRVALDVPQGVTRETWDAYLEVRKAKRAKLTPRAYKLLCDELNRIEHQGGSPEEAVKRSAMNGWTGIFQRPEDRPTGKPAGAKPDYTAGVNADGRF